jgi:hypothetical protein
MYESEDHPAIEDIKFIRKTKRDLASANYAKDTLAWLKELKIEYGPKK